MRIHAQSVDTGSFSNQRFKNKKEKVMNKFSFTRYEDLVNDIDLLVKKLKERNKDDYTNEEVHSISCDIISVANSLNMCLIHYYRRNK